MDFKNIVREIRKSKGMSIATVARLSGVTPATIENWEYRDLEPKLKMLEKVLSALGYELKIVPKEHP